MNLRKKISMLVTLKYLLLRSLSQSKKQLLHFLKLNKTELETKTYIILTENYLKSDDFLAAENLWKPLLDQPDPSDPSLKNIAKYYLKGIEALKNPGNLKKIVDDYKKEKSSSSRKLLYGKKIVIFTAISGAHDNLKFPLHVDNHLDYIVFTDPGVRTSVWDSFHIYSSETDATRRARYIKTHPHEYFPNYDLAIWVDANVAILDDITLLIKSFINSKSAVSYFPHPFRNNVYDEAHTCQLIGRDNVLIIEKQMQRYRKENFQGDTLAETGVMFFDLKNPQTAIFLDFWWNEIHMGSKRDQLSLTYALSKTDTPHSLLSQKPKNVRNHESFALIPHGKDWLSEKLYQCLNT
jgi:hypothetical protein